MRKLKDLMTFKSPVSSIEWSDLNQVILKKGNKVYLVELSCAATSQTLGKLIYLPPLKSDILSEVHEYSPNHRLPKAFWSLSYEEVTYALTAPDVSKSLFYGPEVTDHIIDFAFSPLTNGSCYLAIVYYSGNVIVYKIGLGDWLKCHDISQTWLQYCKSNYNLGMKESVDRFRTSCLTWGNDLTLFTAQQDGFLVIYKGVEFDFHVNKVIDTKTARPFAVHLRNLIITISYYNGRIKEIENELVKDIWVHEDNLRPTLVKAPENNLMIVKRYMLLLYESSKIVEDVVECLEPIIKAHVFKNRSILIITQDQIRYYDQPNWPFDVDKHSHEWKPPNGCKIATACISPNETACLVVYRQNDQTQLVLVSVQEIKKLEASIVRFPDTMLHLKMNLLTMDNFSEEQINQIYQNSVPFPINYWILLLLIKTNEEDPEDNKNDYIKLQNYQINGLKMFGSYNDIKDKLQSLLNEETLCIICNEQPLPIADLRYFTCRKKHVVPICCQTLDLMWESERMRCLNCQALANVSLNQFCSFCNGWMEKIE